MKTLISILLVCLPLAVTAQSIKRNHFTTNQVPYAYVATNDSRDIYLTGSVKVGSLSVSNSGTVGFIGIQNTGTNIITINGTNGIITANSLIVASKAAFLTNYTVGQNDSVLFCTGTNQLITLPNATNSTPTGRMLTVVVASTTGSAILTNANGVQTIRAGLSLAVASTNRVTVISDGSNWW